MINNTVSFNTETTTPSSLLEQRKKKRSLSGVLSLTPSQPISQMKSSAPVSSPQQAQPHPQTVGLVNGLTPEQTQQLNSIRASAANPQPSQTVGQPQSQRGLITPPSFGGLVGQVAQASRPNYPQREAVGGLMGGDYQQRIQDAIDAQNRAVNINQALNQGVVDQSKNPIPLSFQQGRAGAIQRDYGVQADAAVRAAQNAAAIAGLTQQGLSSAGGLANTQQSQRLQGLESAAGLAAPQVSQYGQTSFNPVSGQFGGGGSGGNGNLDPQTQASSLAQQVMNGQITYGQALSSLGYAGQVGSTFLNNAITGMGGNPLQLQAQGNVTQSNITTLGTAAANARAASIGSQTSTINDLSAARQSVANIANSLIGQIAVNNGLNPSNINAVNGVAQLIAQNTSNPQYQTLLNQMTDIVATYGQILTPGANTDSSRATAQSLVNQLAQGGTIQQVISSLDQQSQEKISGIQTNVGNLISGNNVNPTGNLINTPPSGGSTYNGITLPY